MFYLRLLLPSLVMMKQQYIFTNSARIHVLLLAALVNIYPFIGRDLTTKCVVIMLGKKIL